MRRRDFLKAIGGIAALSPFHAAAQAKLPIIGFMGAATPSAWAPWTPAFVRRLSELGWVEGKTVRIEYRWAEGSEERYAQIGAEFVKLDVSVLVAVGGDSAKKATSTIPIVVASFMRRRPALPVGGVNVIFVVSIVRSGRANAAGPQWVPSGRFMITEC
jgi:putative tryptophan/tyrosine transport system substrate-binding protein